MGFKKAILVLLLLIILTMGAASAADTNTTSDNLAVSEDLKVESHIDEMSDDILTDGEGTFSDLSIAINGTSENDILDLTKDYKNDGSVSGEGITISKAITIDGKGHTIDADKKSGIFKIEADGVILKNIAFKNVFEHRDGATIYWNGDNGAILNCSFVECKGYNGGYGGAIFWNGTNATVADCSFVDCIFGYTGRGGAIYFEGSNMAVSNCSFVGSLTGSGGHGGAIYLNCINSTVSDSSFVNCSSMGDGGAIYGFNNDNCNIVNCTFENCFMNDENFGGENTLNGGAICFNSNGNCNVTNCNFINCSAELGKAIYANENTIISSCNFVTQGTESLSELVVGGIISNCTINGNKEKTATNMTVTVDDITYGENATFTVILPSDATGNITISIDGKIYGTVTATYSGDENYNPANKSATQTVNKADVDLGISLYPNATEFKRGDTVEFIINLINNGPSDATDITVNLTIPNSLRYKSSNTSIAYEDSRTLIWIIDHLNANNNVSITFY